MRGIALLAAACLLNACTPAPGKAPDGGNTGGCTLQADCGVGLICAAGSCQRPPACLSVDDWPYCVQALDEMEPGLGRRGVCVEDRCAVLCVVDADCPTGQLCTDFGACRDRTDEEAPRAGSGARQPLKAGYGESLLDFPIGMSLGGFSSRAQPADGRYGGGLSESVGIMEALQARALLLDNGENPLMIIRVPLIFTDMSFHEKVARILQEHTGQDWRDQLVISSTHTHSGPARLWPLPKQTLLPLGLFGIGDYSEELHDRLVRSTADAAIAALDNTFDAKLGWQIVEAFDTDDLVAHDRRGATPPFDDNRALLLRVDDSTDTPRVVLFSLGMHGTFYGGDYATADVLGGVERVVEDVITRRVDRRVPTMFINQNSGTMAPSASRSHSLPQLFERVGHVFVQKTLDAILQMPARSDVEIRSRTTRFPMTYDRMGYAPGEWSTESELPFGGEFYYGGVNCFASFTPDEAFETWATDEVRGCLGLHTLFFNHPPTPNTRSQITAISLDGLSIVTMPGELSMELSWQVLRTLRDRHGVDPLHAFTWGYAQDHQLYLLPDVLGGEKPPFPGISIPKAPSEYPERAFSYLRGEYESSLVPWGERSGDFLVDKAALAFERLQDPEAGGADVLTAPLFYSPTGDPPFPIDLSDANRVGQVVQDLPEQVGRFQTVEFAWVGGDPGAEAPQAPLVTLLRAEQDGTTFSPVLLPGGVPYTNHAGRMLTRLRRKNSDVEWVVRWEELRDFPAGLYKMQVQGHYLAGDDDRRSYTTESRAFELRPIDTITVTLTPEGRTLRGTLSYPAGMAYQEARATGDRGALAGTFRLRHPEIPVQVPAPVEPGVDLDDNGVRVHIMSTDLPMVALTTQMETVMGLANVPVTHFETSIPNSVPAGTVQVTVEVTDLHGNTGTLTQMVAVP